MKNINAIAASVLMMTAPASAADLYTPVLPASSVQHMTCRILNVTSSTQVVTVQAVEYSGTVANSLVNVPLAPGEANGFSISGGLAKYCKFSVKGSGDGFRAAIEIFELTPDLNFRTITALPAR